MNGAEDMGYVVIAVPALLVGLARLKVHAPHGTGIDGDARDMAYAAGNLDALVVATLADAVAAQGNGHDDIDAVEEGRCTILGGKHGAKGFGGVGRVVVLEVVDQLAGSAAALVEEQGATALDGDAAPEHVGHIIVGGRGVVARAGQAGVADRAECVLAGRESLATHGAMARAEQVVESGGEVSHRAER